MWLYSLVKMERVIHKRSNTVLDSCGEEGAVPEGEALDLLNHVLLKPHLWLPLALFSD